MPSIAPPSPYEEHRQYVLAVLGRRCGWLEPGDREALLHDAYAVFLEKQRDGSLDTSVMRPAQIRAYLTQTALNKALDEGKRAGRRRSVPLVEEAMAVTAPNDHPDELLAARLDRARVREIVSELPERQQQIVSLRFFFDRTPEQIQRYLGVTERVYRREMERGMRRLSERFELVRAGTFCESRRSLIRAYVAGIAGPKRMLEARRHLETCPACMHWAMELRVAGRRAAAAVPLPIVTVATGHRWLGKLGWAWHGPRDRIVDALGHVRSHAEQLAVRIDASSPAAFAGIRPGAAAAIVAGCIAVGSGATYCTVNGIPAPVRSLIGISHPLDRDGASRATDRAKPSPTLTTTTAASSPRSTTSTSTARKRTTRSTAHGAQAKRVHKATAPEFGLGAGQPTSSTPWSSSAAARPSSGSNAGASGREFGP